METEAVEKEAGKEYLKILKGLMELPFNVGKNLLVDFLTGDYKNKSISKNRLDELYNFDTLHWDKEKILRQVDELIANGMIELSPSDYNKYIKVLKITIKGQNEIVRPTLDNNKLKNNIDFSKAKITEEDKKIFLEHDGFLSKFNEEQKKAIISNSGRILSVAGAGSGKTTVLTKRIEYLVKYRNVPAEEILAITFTRKARTEMEKRLKELDIYGVRVNTFNSFCEKFLKRYEFEIYGRQMGVQGYSDKIVAINMALGTLGIDMEEALRGYFTKSQRKFKTDNQLANNFMNDCFSVMEYFKLTGGEYEFFKDKDNGDRENAKMIYQINQYLKEHMDMQGLRDYSDQIIDAVKHMKENPHKVPYFSHVLVDEYQDVNAKQIELIEILKPKNLFAVGDPRQSIFGWRGSDIKYILEFEKQHGSAQIIHLTKNYRSNKKIVDFMNRASESMGLPDLEHHIEDENSRIEILNFDNEHEEREFVMKKILESKIPREEIFVLARTNRQLNELSQLMNVAKIPHIVKTDEVKRPVEGRVGEITLATIHAIKGLEAKKVFLIGASEQNFPCKASDHPAIEMVRLDNYNKTEEEKRLFYVAVSRAKEILYISYVGKKPTYFMTDSMVKIANSQ